MRFASNRCRGVLHTIGNQLCGERHRYRENGLTGIFYVRLAGGTINAAPPDRVA